jgi:RimJ/RimL family protein N-acetyltransferase
VRCYSTADVREFAAAVLPWLARDPFGNNVVSTLTASRSTPAAPAVPDALWLTIADGPDPIGVAVMTPPRGLLLGIMPIAAIPAIVDWLVDQGIRPPSIDGPAELSDAFSTAYERKAPVTATVSVGTRMFRLDRVDWPTPVAGSARAATADDRELLVDWSDRFSRDIHPELPAADPAAPVDQRLRSSYPQLMWLWEVDGVAVSMAWLNEPVAGVSRVSGVYTPNELRGHGYASAVVAHTSQHALDTTSTACMLYTDRANPTSNKIYQAIGYRPIGEGQQWIFTPATDPAAEPAQSARQ